MAEPVLCLLPSCCLPGRQHRDGCDEDRCTCLRAQAQDGSRLCALHTRRIGQDATTLAELYGELELRLLGGTGMGERVGGTPDDTRAPNPAAVEVRSEIRHVLVAWCKFISEERGWSLPVDEIIAMGAYVARSAEWLAATDYADEAAGELGELRRRAWGIAYPSGTRRVVIGPCPKLVLIKLSVWAETLVGCGGTVHALLRATDSTLPSELVCDADPEHHWAAPEWRAFARAVRERAA